MPGQATEGRGDGKVQSAQRRDRPLPNAHLFEQFGKSFFKKARPMTARAPSPGGVRRSALAAGEAGGGGPKSPDPDFTQPATSTFADFNFGRAQDSWPDRDLWGAPCGPSRDPRGRKTRRPAAEIAEKVRELTARGATVVDVAAAIGMTSPTLRVHYFRALCEGRALAKAAGLTPRRGTPPKAGPR